MGGGAGGRLTARRCCHLGTRERGGRGRGSTGLLSGKPTGTGPASRCRKNASVSIRRTSRSPRPPERCGLTSSGINFFITVSTLMAAGQVSRSLELPAWPRGYAHGCWSKRPSRLSQSEFPRELARQSGQSHMEFAVVEGWRRLLGEWRYQLGSRVPERRGTRVGAFLCS